MKAKANDRFVFGVLTSTLFFFIAGCSGHVSGGSDSGMDSQGADGADSDDFEGADEASPLQAITIRPPTAQLSPGKTLHFYAQGLYQDGSLHDITASVLWDSSDPSVASIEVQGTDGGKASAAAPGNVTIRAALGNVTSDPSAALAVVIDKSPFNTDRAIGVPYLLLDCDRDPAQFPAWGPFGGLCGHPWNSGLGKYQQFLDSNSSYQISLHGKQIPKPLAVIAPIVYYTDCMDTTPGSIYSDHYGRSYGYSKQQKPDGTFTFCGGDQSGDTTDCQSWRANPALSHCDIPLYATSGPWWDEWARTIDDFATMMKDDARVQWVVITTGLYGENFCAKVDNDCPNMGRFSNYYQNTVERFRSQFKRADGTSKALFLSIANWNTAGFASYLANLQPPVGVKLSGLAPEIVSSHVLGTYAGWGPFDALESYQDKTNLCFEPRQGGPVYNEGRPGLYFRDLMVLALHPMADVLYDNDISENLANEQGPNYIPFLVDHLGVTINETPDVWIALRDTRNLCCANILENCALPSTDTCADTIQSAHNHEGDCAACGSSGYRTTGQRGDFSFWLYRPEGIPQNRTVALVKGEPNHETEMPSDAATRSYLYSYALRRTDQASGNTFMSFKVDDNFPAKKYLQEGVRVTIIYFVKGADAFSLEYTDRTGTPKTHLVQKPADRVGQWVEQNFELPGAVLNNGYYSGQADFRINCNSDGDEYIHMVKVSPL